jgi:integrase
MMNWWLENGYLEKLPAFPKVAARHNRRPHFDQRDWETLTNCFAEFVAIKHAPTRRDRILLVNYVLVLAATGIRVGEARMLKWRDIRPFQDPKMPETTHVALMVNGKTGKREAVAHSGSILEQFSTILKLRQADLDNSGSDIFGKRVVPPDSYVFCGRNGKPIQSFKNSFNSLIEKARVATDSYGCRRTIYSLRHTYATFRLQEGVNPYILARNMGTSVAMLEDFYGHTSNVSSVDELTKPEVNRHTIDGR